ncbi:MAG: hypothetical protein H0X25_05785 [Acidobacteriales bacterium]|nr:hypothetical protein [Terriglobales bacterium]
MRLFRSILMLILLALAVVATAGAQTGACPSRPGGGALITDPTVLRSVNGTLRVQLTMYTDVAEDGSTEYCYVYADGTEAPTLMVNPGDRILFTLVNGLPMGAPGLHAMKAHTPAGLFPPE